VTLETGIKTEKWWDCHYIPALNATVTAEWYFTGILNCYFNLYVSLVE